MAETTELIKLLADQIQVQRQQMEQQAKHMEQRSQQHRAEMEQQAKQMEQHSLQHRAQMEQQAQHHREEMHNLLKILDVQNMALVKMIPVLIILSCPLLLSLLLFAAFDSTSELWPDYWSRSCTFVVASAVPEQRQAQVFLTNQTAAVYKQL